MVQNSGLGGDTDGRKRAHWANRAHLGRRVRALTALGALVVGVLSGCSSGIKPSGDSAGNSAPPAPPASGNSAPSGEVAGVPVAPASPSIPSSITISVVPALGAFGDGNTVTAYDTHGAQITSAITTVGRATLTIPPSLTTLILQASGCATCTYYDEGTKTNRPFGPSARMRALVTQIVSTKVYAVTLLTDMAATFAGVHADPPTLMTVADSPRVLSPADAIATVKVMFGLEKNADFDITSAPALVSDASPTIHGSGSAELYAAILGSIAQELQKSHGDSVSQLNAARAMVADAIETGNTSTMSQSIAFQTIVQAVNSLKSNGSTIATDLSAALISSQVGTPSSDVSIGAPTGISPDPGPSLTVLHSLAAISTDGMSPQGHLVENSSGSTFFGMTYGGGVYSFGTVFSIGADGSNNTLLHSFGYAADGAYPTGSLALSEGTLYGMTKAGGAYGGGTIFRVGIHGSNYTVLRDFEPLLSTDGSSPSGDLIVSGSTMYGMTRAGGANDAGVIFSIRTDGTGLVV